MGTTLLAWTNAIQFSKIAVLPVDRDCYKYPYFVSKFPLFISLPEKQHMNWISSYNLCHSIFANLANNYCCFFFFPCGLKKIQLGCFKGRFLLIFSQMKFAMLSDQQEVSRKSVVWYSLVDMISMKTEHLFSWDSLRWEENIFRT